MEKNIKIYIKDRVAVAEGDPVIVCGNGDYTVTFSFDEEWGEAFAKTARFKFNTAEGPAHIDQPFTGDTVEVPELSDIREVEVGVFVGDLNTTTGASIRCKPCIRCGGGAPKDPTPDVYDEIMELINESGGAGAEGLSAYEVAVKNGFEGSEEEWLESLRGAPGETGPQGPQGEKGEPGLSEIGEGAIDSKHIKENAVEGRHIVNEAIDGHHLQNDSVGDGHIREGAVTESKISDGAVTGYKIAKQTIKGENIARRTITGALLAEGAVNMQNLDSLAVMQQHLASSSVSTSKIVDEAVTEAKIADGAVTKDKLETSLKEEIEQAQNTANDAKTAATAAKNIADSTLESFDYFYDNDLKIISTDVVELKKQVDNKMDKISVTSEDNGKFLMVVDGKVSAVSVPNITKEVF